MIRIGFAVDVAALGLCGFVTLAGPAAAQSVPRIKAVVVSFEGSQLTVLPDGEKQTMKIGVRPATRILREEQKTLADIQAGDYIGATVIKGAARSSAKTEASVFTAQEVHIFPAALKGSGEGLYPAAPGSGRFILNGTVRDTAAKLTVDFRGESGDGAACIGRAPVNPLNGCQGSAVFTVPPAAPVIALAAGNKSQLVPGAVLALSIMAGPDGKPVTPGLTIETLATPPLAGAARPTTPVAKKRP